MRLLKTRSYTIVLQAHYYIFILRITYPFILKLPPMKKLHPGFLLNSVFIILILYSKSSFSQCASGPVSLGKSYDTTVSTGSGNYATVFKFPKFRPDSGMVTCVRLILTITGVTTIF